MTFLSTTNCNLYFQSWRKIQPRSPTWRELLPSCTSLWDFYSSVLASLTVQWNTFGQAMEVTVFGWVFGWVVPMSSSMPLVQSLIRNDCRYRYLSWTRCCRSDKGSDIESSCIRAWLAQRKGKFWFPCRDCSKKRDFIDSSVNMSSPSYSLSYWTS